MGLYASHRAYDNDQSAPIHNPRTFVIDKYLDAVVDGYHPIEKDAKVDGTDTFFPGVHYRPPAPTIATAGQKRGADAMRD